MQFVSSVNSASAIQSCMFAAAESNISILTSPAAGQFLDAFQVDPENGQLQIPRIGQDQCQLSLPITSETLSHLNGAMLARTAQLLREEVESFKYKGSISNTVPNTDGRWSVDALYKSRLLIFRSPDSIIRFTMGKESLSLKNIEVGTIKPYTEATFQYSIEGVNFAQVRTHCCKMAVEEIFVEGLRTYFEIPIGLCLEALPRAICGGLDFDRVNDDHSLAWQGEVGVLARNDIFVARIFASWIPEMLDSGTYSERLQMYIHQQPEHRNGEFKLSPELLRLWRWIESRPEPSEEELQRYYKRAKARYWAPRSNKPS